MTEEVHAPVAVAPLVVVPADEFEEPFIQADARSGVKNAGILAMDEVGGDHLVRSVFEDSFKIGLGCLFHRSADFFVGGVLGSADG